MEQFTEQQWVDAALIYLKQNKIINEDEYNVFIDYYQSNQIDFKTKQEDLMKMYKNDKNFINQVYKELTEEIDIIEIDEQKEIIEIDEQKEIIEIDEQKEIIEIDKQKEIIEIDKQKEIIDVSDLKQNEKDYIIIRYSNDETKILENTLNEQGSQLYFILKEKYIGQNTTKLFEQLTKNLKEVNNLNISELEQNIINNDGEEQVNQNKITKNKTKIIFLSKYKWLDNAAFTNILFIVFVTGISIGIVLMIILNLFAK